MTLGIIGIIIVAAVLVAAWKAKGKSKGANPTAGVTPTVPTAGDSTSRGDLDKK